MWCGGQCLRYGTDWMLSMPSCTLHDRSLRLWRIRAAASAPFQPTQFAQDEGINTNGVAIRRALSPNYIESRPTSSPDGEVTDHLTTKETIPPTATRNQLHQLTRRRRGMGSGTTPPVSGVAKQAVPADQPRLQNQGEQAGWEATANPNGHEGIELETSRTTAALSYAGSENVTSGTNCGSSSTINSGSSRDAEILILAIARCDLQQQQQQQQEQTGVSVVGLLSGFGAVPQLDADSLLHALDRLPDNGVGPTGKGPWATEADALLGPGKRAVAIPGDTQPHDLRSTQLNPSLQDFHIPDALRGLFSVIAPASALPARPESSRRNALQSDLRILPNPASSMRLSLHQPAPAQPATSAAATEAAAQFATAPPDLASSPAAEGWTVPGNLQESVPVTEVNIRQQSTWQQQQRPRELLGPQFAGRDPAAAPLLYEAAGVALPLWAAQSLPPPAPGLYLDPSLEWALGVLSSQVTPREPRLGEVGLANRILAAHLGPPLAVQARPAAAPAGPEDTRRAAPFSGAGRQDSRTLMMALPWSLLLPVLDVVADRLSPSSALALLRGISCQVGPHWRRELSPRDQARLTATLRVCFRSALRNPGTLSASAAAGLMQVMCRLHVRSEHACALLVDRILMGLVPVRRATASPRSSSAPSSLTPPLPSQIALTDPVGTTEPASSACSVQAPGRRILQSLGTTRSMRIVDCNSSRSGQEMSGQLCRRAATRATRVVPLRRAGGVARGGNGPGETQLADGLRWRRVQLRWACIAMSTLARLRIPRFALPQRAMTKLLWAALFASAHWTPGIAAALPVWAARLDYPPPASFLRRYSKALLGTSACMPSAGSVVTKGGQWRRRRRRQGHLDRKGRAKAVATGDGDGDAAAAIRLRGRRCLVDRMTAPQLAAAMEALVAHYGQCTARPEALATAVADAVSAGSSQKVVGHIFSICCADGVHSKSVGSSNNNDDGDAVSIGNNGHGEKGGRSLRAKPSTSSRLALRYSDYRKLMHTLAAALFPRLRQLKWQQLCRLPLLLCRVGEPDGDGPLKGEQWQQVFVHHTRRLLPSCDAVDLMLLLRGLAALNTRAVGQTDANTDYTRTISQYMYEWLGIELADDVLRQYTVLLPSATLYHTAAVLESVSLLWGQSPHLQQAKAAQQPAKPGSWVDGTSCPQPSAKQQRPDAITFRNSVATSAAVIKAKAGPESRKGVQTPPPPAPHTAATPPLAPLTPEADLQLRRQVDLASERDFLMQQLDEHVATCLAYSRGRCQGPGTTRRRVSGRHHQDEAGARVAVGLVVKVLAAYGRLQRPPQPQLQRALEATLVERADLLGTSGWQRVRAAYQEMLLQPGPELNVALLTFA